MSTRSVPRRGKLFDVSKTRENESSEIDNVDRKFDLIEELLHKIAKNYLNIYKTQRQKMVIQDTKNTIRTLEFLT